jgi:Flp pilus assembly protein TadG
MRNRHSCRGQNLVEFSLVLPIMIISMLGILEFGLVYFTRASVENAAREGARYAAIHPTDVSGIQTRVRRTVGGLDPSTLTINVTYPDGDSLPTERVQVSVSYPLTTFWPGPHSGTYGTSSTMRIEKE